MIKMAAITPRSVAFPMTIDETLKFLMNDPFSTLT